MLTHGQAWARAQTVASRLADRGIRPGDRIALALPNGWRYAVAYYGVQLAGAITVLVNTRLMRSAQDLQSGRRIDLAIRDSAIEPEAHADL
jgi:acyl-CoA synthetase (AMP-forming)/AMP-acid ligase II